jgi:hypothetical protein
MSIRRLPRMQRDVADISKRLTALERRTTPSRGS